MISILLVDDQNLVQEGIKSLLEQYSDLKVIGTVKDGRSAIKQIDVLRPDIVLLDIEMPGMDGITATKYITHLSPQTKVIILSSHEDKKYLTQALMAGAKAYILKSSLSKDLKQAILAVNDGYTHIESRLLAKIFDPTNIKSRNSQSKPKVNKVNRQSQQSASTPKNQVEKQKTPANLSKFPRTEIVEPNNLAESIELEHNQDQYNHNPQANDQIQIYPPNSNQFLPAIVPKSSSSKLSSTTDNSSTQLSVLGLRGKNYLRGIISNPQIVKYQRQLTQLYQLKVAQSAPIIRSLKAKIAQQQSRLFPIIQYWYQQGCLTNVGLILLGFITVIIIRLFS